VAFHDYESLRKTFATDEVARTAVGDARTYSTGRLRN